MDTLQVILTVTCLVILAEVTFLVVKMPRQTFNKKQGRPILVDTSVLIDGRIISVAKSGFVTDTLVIPRSVVGELQFLADNADHDKRSRARYGLDVVSELQSIPEVTVEIMQDSNHASEGVDNRLLSLAKKHSAAVCTIDYNLNKVAIVEGIPVLNVNELAQSLRMAYLPGERLLLELVQKGQDTHQGVGYLPDGTMVVVEHSSKFIGQSVEVEFIRSLQTAAGKMMFARRVDAQNVAARPQQKPMGKKPVQAQAVVEKAPEAPKQAQKPIVYHSDSQDQRAAIRPKKPQQRQQRHDAKPEQEATPKAGNEQKSQPKKNNNRRPVKKDRESALIDLVDKHSQ